MTLRQKPEEQELSRRRAELAALEVKLAQRELGLATLKAELRAFEARYLRTVGVRYAALDELQAQIAEAQARLRPKDPKSRTRAAKARAQAEESAQSATPNFCQARPEAFRPSENLRKLYREVARCIHPDLAANEDERMRRTHLMARANQAYEEGGEAALQAILLEWENTPESVKGDGVGADLVRVIRRIAQVEERLRSIDVHMAALRASDLFQLRAKVDEAEYAGRDLLTEMSLRVDEQIAAAREWLSKLGRKASDI